MRHEVPNLNKTESTLKKTSIKLDFKPNRHLMAQE